MRTAIIVAHMLVRFSGLILIILGVLIWIDNTLPLVPIHMLLGLVFVLSLWTLAFLAARSGAPRGVVALVIGWGAIVVILGVTQTQLLPGPQHWVIQVLHLLVGLGAIGQAEGLAARVKRAQ
jgi:hypothetical protein